MSPSDLEVLIHYHVSLDKHPRIGAPAVQDAIQKFINNGILRGAMTNADYELTDRGRCWLDMILGTPYPQQIWVDPRTMEPV